MGYNPFEGYGTSETATPTPTYTATDTATHTPTSTPTNTPTDVPSPVCMAPMMAMSALQQTPANGLNAEFFNDTPQGVFQNCAATLIVDNIDFQWMTDEVSDPDATDPLPDGVSSQHFSAIFTGWIQLPTSGTYEFELTADDGARVLINNQVVINDFFHPTSDGPDPVTGTFNSSGINVNYPIRIEYYQIQFATRLQLRWRLYNPADPNPWYVVPSEILFPQEPVPPTPVPTSTSVPTESPTPLPTVIPTPNPTLTPTLRQQITILFGGSYGDGIITYLNVDMLAIHAPGPSTNCQIIPWHEASDYQFQYPGSLRQNPQDGLSPIITTAKRYHANNALGTPNIADANVFVIGYSAGADSALIFANDYVLARQSDLGTGTITGLLLLGGTLSGSVSGSEGQDPLSNVWTTYLDRVLATGIHVYVHDDNDGSMSLVWDTYTDTTGRFEHVISSAVHLDNLTAVSACQQPTLGIGTNNSYLIRDTILQWFDSRNVLR